MGKVLTKGELNAMSKRIDEIEEVLNLCSDNDDDVADNLCKELDDLVYILEESIANHPDNTQSKKSKTSLRIVS